MTHAIFHNSPCKDLLEDYNENHKPLEEIWKSDANLWEALSADPFPCVSKFVLEAIQDQIHMTHLFVFADIENTAGTTRTTFTLPSTFW